MSAALSRSFASFAVPNYRIYFGGQLASLAGNWMQIVAELWLVLALTGSAIAVGITTALQFSGILVFGMLGGALADRFDKRRLLIATQTAMALPAIAMFALSLAGALEPVMIYALVAVRGLVLAVDNPTRQAFVIEIVGADQVVNAVNLNSVLVHSARIAGPALAGVIIAFWGAELCFAINALSFTLMIAALMRMDRTRLNPAGGIGSEGAVRAGLRYVWRTPALRLPLLLMAVLGTLGFNFPVILPLLAAEEFGGEVSAYSLLMIAMGVGAIAGALVAGSRSRVGRGVIAAAAATFAASSVGVAVAPSLATAMVGMVPLGAASVTFAAAINSGLQLDAAPEMRGRVMSLYSIVFLGSTPIGAPLIGWVAEAYGSRSTLLVGAAAALVVCGVIGWHRLRASADSAVDIGSNGEARLPARPPALRPSWGAGDCGGEGRRGRRLRHGLGERVLRLRRGLDARLAGPTDLHDRPRGGDHAGTGETAGGCGDGRSNPRRAQRRSLRLRFRSERAAGGRGLVRAAVPQILGSRSRLRRRRSQDSRP